MRTLARILFMLALALGLAAPLAAGAQGQPDDQRFELLPVPSGTPHVTGKRLLCLSDAAKHPNDGQRRCAQPRRPASHR